MVVLTLIQQCLDVAMRRWNNVLFRRHPDISIVAVSRRHSNVRIQRWNNVDMTSLCLLGIRPMGTKLGKMMTYYERLPFLKSHYCLITWPTWGKVTNWKVISPFSQDLLSLSLAGCYFKEVVQNTNAKIVSFLLIFEWELNQTISETFDLQGKSFESM